MARNKGTFNFAANFEVLTKAPLDARMLVGSYADLTLPGTWGDAEGNVWLFDGAIISVAGDPDSGRDGIYFLTDATNYTSEDSWEKLGSTDSSIFGAINISEDPSAQNVYAGLTPDGSLQFRGIAGSGGITVTENLGTVYISTDASYSGQANYGQNLGSGDVSVFQGMSGDALSFKTIKGSTNISLQQTDTEITIDVSGNVQGVNGGVFVTNITPNGIGNVGDKVYTPDGVVLQSCLTDTDDVNVEVLAITGNTNYTPLITIEGNPVGLNMSSDKPMFTGTYSMDLSTLPDPSTLTIVHEDGAEHSVLLAYDAKPIILDASFGGGYPGVQTELKENDTFQITVITDVPITQLIVDNSGACKSDTYAVSGTENTITVNIANRGNTSQSVGFNLRVVKDSGSTSDTWISEGTYGSTDGVDVVTLNNIRPSVSFGVVAYPSNQEAIKNGETATISNTITDFDTVTYSSPNGQVTPQSPTSYEPSKVVAYSSGDYNVSTANISVTAHRIANDTNSSDTDVIWIANVAATLTVQNPAARLRSGGNDGTSIQNHSIAISSNQRLLGGGNAPTLQVDGGTTADWSSSPVFSGGPTSWTNALSVHDNDAKGTYSWGAISGVNLAGRPTTTNSGTSNYVLGGFVSRTVNIGPSQLSGQINVPVIDDSKLTDPLVWIKDIDFTFVGDSTTYQPGKWSIDALLSPVTTINILDTQAAQNNTTASSFTIQESV